MLNIFIKKLDKTLEIDFDTLPEATKSYVINYGLKQTLNDSIAGATKAEAEGLLAARLDALLAGTCGQRAVGGGIGELERIAKSIVKKLFKSKGLTGTVLESKVEEAWNHPKVMAKAEAELAERKAAAIRAAGLLAGLDLPEFGGDDD